MQYVIVSRTFHTSDNGGWVQSPTGPLKRLLRVPRGPDVETAPSVPVCHVWTLKN